METPRSSFVPLDKLKVYRNHVRVNNILRRLNYSTKFTLSEVPATDSVDIDMSLSSINGALNDLSDVAVSSPQDDDILKHNGTGQFVNVSIVDLIGIEQLADVIFAGLQTGDHLIYNGVNWTNDPDLRVLNDLTDTAITNPIIGHTIRYDGNEFVNVPAREELACHFSFCGEDDVDATYVDAVWFHITKASTALTGGTKAIMPIDFTNKIQYKIALAFVVSAGTPDVRIVDDSDPTNNILHEFTDIGSSTQITSLTNLPEWATGVKTLRIQVGGGSGTTDIGVPSCSVYLK